MAMDRPDVADYVAWGNLIKKWSRGKPPADLQDLKDQCATANVGLHLPTYMDKLHVVKLPKEFFVLRIPPADMIADSENEIGQGGDYPIPQFYLDRFGKKPDLPTLQDKLDFHAQRIGDYVIRLCA